VAAAHQSAIKRQTQAEVRKKRAMDVYRDAVEEHAQSFVDARLSIINDPTAPAGDRLRAMEQLESRALGKPTEHVTTDTGETPAQRMLRSMSTEQLEQLVQRRLHLRPIEDER
jgi:hypothetical protein